MSKGYFLGGPDHLVMVTMRDNKDNIIGSYQIPIVPLLEGGGSS